MLDRRTFTKSTIISALASPAIVGRAIADDEILIAAILDLSGGLDIYGKPILMCMRMAVDEINDAGGLNGKKVRIISYDTQSNMQLYAQYAQQASLQDKVQLVHGGITSASREVMRPILHRNKTLYFYSTFYEGGVCDKNTFCTGATPAMMDKEPIGWAVREWGRKIFLIGADYNAPRIHSLWDIKYAKEYGGAVVANEFFPLSVTEFGQIITRIQIEKPDVLLSILVGAPQMGFYRQWASAGMLKKIPLLSLTFGAGNEHELLPATDSDGIVAPYNYFMEIDTPENKAWVIRYHEKFGADAPYVNLVSMGGYEATMVWATAVRKAGTADRDAVIRALESDLKYSGPAGDITMIGKLHHAARDVYIARCHDRKWEVFKSWKQQYPSDAGDQCDLLKNPDTNKQFTPI